ncbi:MBL fold metallo-hydrolase [Candidatus Hepatincolaceae symbiont of Richtersius coronifer]
MITILSILLIFYLASKAYINLLKNEVYYKGPVTELFDGKTFKRVSLRPENLPEQKPNEDGKKYPTTSLFRLVKSLFFKDEFSWDTKSLTFKQVVPTQTPSEDIIKIYYINHSTVLIQTNGLNIISDPIYSKVAGPWNLIGPRRHHKPGIDFKDLPKIDVVLISHNHYDHMDIPTLKNLYYRDNPLFITLAGNDYILKKNISKNIQVKGLLWEEYIILPNNIKINAEAAYHWSRRGLYDRNKALWGSFVIQTPKHNIFFAGDTAFYTGEIFKDLKAKYQTFSLALLPIGAYEPNNFMKYSHINPYESAKIHQIINAQKSVSIHYGTFQLSYETYFQPREDLEKAKKDLQIPAEGFVSIDPGNSLILK